MTQLQNFIIKTKTFKNFTLPSKTHLPSVLFVLLYYVASVRVSYHVVENFVVVENNQYKLMLQVTL